MITVSIALFALSAVLGLVLAFSILRKRETPKAVVYSHGVAAAVALVLLIFYAIQNPDNAPVISIGVFAVAAVGGFVMFFNDLRKKPGPVSLVFVHAIAAVTGFLLLLTFVYL